MLKIFLVDMGVNYLNGDSMRRLTSVLASTTLLLALVSGQALMPKDSVAASEVPCIATATGRVVNSSGTPIFGDTFFQVVAENLGTPYLSNFRWVETNSINGFQICFDAELDPSLYSEEGDPGAKQYAPDLNFAEGDVIRISVSVEPKDGSATYQEISLTATQATALNSGPRSINLGDIQVSGQSQIGIVLKNEAGSLVNNAQWQIGKSSQGEDERYIDNLMLMGVTDSNGHINASGLPDGEYGIYVDTPFDSTLGYVGRAYFFNILNGNVSWVSNTDGAPLDIANLVLPLANFRLDVRMPDGTPLTLNETFGLSADIIVPDPYRWYPAQPQGSGIVALVDSGKTYQVDLHINSSEGRLAGLLGGTFEVSVTADGTNVVGTESNTVRLKEPNLTLIPTPRIGDRSSISTYLMAAEGICIELSMECINSVEDERVSTGIVWRQGSAGESSYVLPLPSEGESKDYWAVLNPDGEYSGVAKTVHKFTATNAGGVISYNSESGINWNGKKGTVSMKSPNFKVRTYSTNADGTRGTPISSISVSTNRSDENGNESVWHYFNNATDNLGESGGYLLDSTYQIYLEARSESVSKTASAMNFEITLLNGEISLAALPEYFLGNVTVDANGVLEVNLPRPNVLGKVVTPEGDVDPYANVSFEKQNCQSSDCYKWANVDSQGKFASFLTPGLYKTTVSPSWKSQDSFASNSTDFLVESSEKMCSGSNVNKAVNPNSCLVNEKSNLQLSLAVPNLSGVVKAGTMPVNNNGGIRIEKFRSNSSQIDYGKMQWVNVDSSGRYKVNIQEPGSYQMIFDSVEGLDGYTATKVYFAVSGSSESGFMFCAANKPIGNKEPVCRTSATASPFALDLSLSRSNLTMSAIEAEGISFDWAYGWAQSMSSGIGTSNEFVNFNFSRTSKKAYLNLGEIGSIKKYKINIDFGKQDGSSIKKNLVLWAADFDEDAETIEFCLDKHFFAGNAGVAPRCKSTNSGNATDEFISGLQTLDVLVSPGVFRGVVSTPEQSPRKVRFAQVQVKKWTENSWGNAQNRQGWWQWTDNYSSTDREGRYSLDITTPGVYLVEARTPWGSDAYPYAPGENVIRVIDETGDEATICEYGNKPKDGDQFLFDFGPCNNQVASLGIDTKFKNPNLVGTVSWGGKATSDAWVNAYALKTVNCGDSCSYVSRTWVSLQMNDSGKFFASLSPGDYEVEANPNNRLSGVAVKSTSEFSINDQGQLLDKSDNPVSELDISLAEPNIRGKVCAMGTTSPCVPAEWTHVGVINTSNLNNWSYSYANTNDDGEFSLLLELGNNYQFHLYSSDSLRLGTNSVFSVNVLDNQDIENSIEAPQCVVDNKSPIDCSNLFLTLNAPNVKGTMMYEVVAGQQTATPWSWINVWSDTQNQNFWTGAGTNSSGEFALTLPKETTQGNSRTYSATAYFYGVDEQRAPLDFQIRGQYVAGLGGAPGTTKFTWKYRGQNEWSDIPIAGMTPNFDFVQPNSRITLVGVPNDGKRVIRIVSGTGLSEKIFRVTTSGNPSNNFAEVNLPKTVLANVRVVPEVGETFVGCYQKTITPENDPGGIQTRITINVSTSCN